MKQIEELAAQKPDPALIALSNQANADALVFEASLREGDHWKQGAEEKVTERLDKIWTALPGLDLKSAFAYKATMRIVVNLIVSSDVAVVERFYRKMRAHHEASGSAAIAKRLMQGHLSERERFELREFQGLLGDSVTMFYNAADLVMGKHGFPGPA